MHVLDPLATHDAEQVRGLHEVRQVPASPRSDLRARRARRLLRPQTERRDATEQITATNSATMGCAKQCSVLDCSARSNGSGNNPATRRIANRRTWWPRRSNSTSSRGMKVWETAGHWVVR